VAFQGRPGAFSEDAAIKLLGAEIELVPCATFMSLFSSIDEGRANYALAPIENSLVGKIEPCVDLLRNSELIIKDEVTIPIAQHLIGCPGTSLREIEIVESHPVALAQCKNFFAAHPQIKQVEADDTAASVARVIASANGKRAAIAGRRAAELYGGFVIEENVQDRRDNCTRFLLLTLPSSFKKRPAPA
jgi:prephenate dehydratase